MWHFVEQGQGRPLVLLHGIGMSSNAWKPVMARLAEQRRVIAFDTAGFGRTPMMARHIAPTTHNLAKEMGRVLREMGIDEPVDIAGNSMGGWMALEAARLGLARSVVAISPAGLWTRPPAHVKHVFFNIRRVAGLSPRLTRQVLKVGALREAILAVPMTLGGSRIPAEEAFAATMDFVNAEGFDETFAQSHHSFQDGHGIDVPVTVAFGTQDWLLTPSARRRDQLPTHVRWIEPKGWGHVPMWKDPEGVAKVILDGVG